MTDDIEGHITTDIPAFPGVLHRLSFHLVRRPDGQGFDLDQSSASFSLAGIVAHPDSEVPVDKIADAVGERAVKVRCRNCGAVLAVFKAGWLDASVSPLVVACPSCGRHRRIVSPKPKGSKQP